MDDLTLLDPDPKKLSEMVEPVRYWLKKNRFQSMNQRKTKLSPLSRGIHYLGYKIRMTESAEQPLQLFVTPKKKWQWVKELRILENTNFFSKKLHPLAIESSEKESLKKYLLFCLYTEPPGLFLTPWTLVKNETSMCDNAIENYERKKPV